MSDVHVNPAEASLRPKPTIGFRRLVRGGAWNWTQAALTGGLAFFVSPYVVHHLGSTSYGVWVLVHSMVAYMALLDLGMRGAVVRFVSADQPRGLHDEASRAVSAVLWLRLWLGAVVIIATVGLSFVATKVFQIPPEMHTAARVAILISGTTVALSLTFGVFSGILNALHRFDLICAVGIGQAVLIAGGFIILLGRGHGIVAIALWQLIVSLLAGAFLYRMAFRVYPELNLTLRAPEREMIRKIGGYSFFLFVGAVSGQVIYQTDNLVIGAFLPVSAVTLYALGFAPTQYLRQIISSIAVTFLPAASSLGAQGEHEQLRRLLLQGTRVVMAIALPIEVGLFFRGRTFISLWMGPQYGQTSGHVLQVLILSWLFMAGNFCAGNIVYGLSKHRPVAMWGICEAIANFILSVLLVSRFGVIGVAWGTTLPSLVINVVIWPRYIARILEIPLRRYIVQSWIRPAIAIIPFATACFLAERWWPARHLAAFFLQMAALLPFALVGLGLAFRGEISAVLRTKKWLLRDAKPY